MSAQYHLHLKALRRILSFLMAKLLLKREKTTVNCTDTGVYNVKGNNTTKNKIDNLFKYCITISLPESPSASVSSFVLPHPQANLLDTHPN